MTTAIPSKSEQLSLRIESSLDNIRPFLEADGGNVRVIEITKDYVVRV